MRERLSLRAALAGAVVPMFLAGACGPRSNTGGANTGMADQTSAADTTLPVDTAATNPAANPGAAASDTGAAVSDTGAALSDANIVALLDEANKADSAAGAYALKKTSNGDVRGFATQMETDHHALRLQGQQLAKKLNITPEPPANDPVKALAKAEMDSLKAAPKGAQFDRTYIDQEVGVHKAVIDLAEKAHDATQNQELKSLIEKAKPILQTHLDRAESIQKKLGSPSA